jgi:hypothetical protein
MLQIHEEKHKKLDLFEFIPVPFNRIPSLWKSEKLRTGLAVRNYSRSHESPSSEAPPRRILETIPTAGLSGGFGNIGALIRCR